MSVPGDSICQVSIDSISIVRCHISGVRFQVPSDNMSSTGVRYQVSGILCQVYTYQGQVINMSLSCELNTELQHHISAGHVTWYRRTI